MYVKKSVIIIGNHWCFHYTTLVIANFISLNCIYVFSALHHIIANDHPYHCCLCPCHCCESIIVIVSISAINLTAVMVAMITPFITGSIFDSRSGHYCPHHPDPQLSSITTVAIALLFKFEKK